MSVLLNPERFPAINRPVVREEAPPAQTVVSEEMQKRREFYTRLGKPELAEKYDVFEVPAGMGVKDLQDLGSELKYTLYNPSAQLEYEKQLAQFAVDKSASEKFWLSQYPTFHKYAGKYAPVEIPAGMKIKNVTETPEGLSVEFYSPEAVEQQQASRYFWSTRGYPQFAGKYAPIEVPAGAEIKEVTETEAGLQVTFTSPQAEAQRQASIAFYQNIGYPQYAGKYAPFEVPAGREIMSIQEVEGGLEVRYTPTPEEAAAISMAPLMSFKSFAQAVSSSRTDVLPVETWTRQAEVVKQSPAQSLPITTWVRNAEVVKQSYVAQPSWSMPADPASVFIPAGSGGFLRSDYEVAKVEERVIPVTDNQYAFVKQYVFQPKNWQQLEQLATETQAFKKALEKGEITGAEYNTAIYEAYQQGQKLNPVLIPKGQIITRTEEGTIVTELLKIQASGSVFGVFEPDVVGYGMHGEPIPAIKVENAPKGLSYAETRALTGMALVTSIATPLGLPLRSGLFVVGTGGAGTAIAEGLKYATTGEHLTSQEAVLSFATGELAGIGLMQLNARVIRPWAERGLSESYAKTLESGKLWEPTLKEQVLMKLTGAKPQAQFLQAKSIDVLSESYRQQAELNEAVLMNKPLPEGVEGRTALQAWTPTAKEAEIMRVVGVQPKTPVASVNVARVTSGEQVGFVGLQRQFVAEELFDFSVAPKTGLQVSMVSQPQTEKITTLTGYSRLPLYFGLGKDIVNFKEYFGAETSVEKPVEPYVEKPLSFKSSRMYYADGKYVSYVPLGSPESVIRGGMKPLWGSVGSKGVGGGSVAQTVFVKETGGFIGGSVLQAPVQMVQGVKLVNPFAKVIGTSFYSQRNVVEETESIVLSYPNAGLAQPSLLVKEETRITTRPQNVVSPVSAVPVVSDEIVKLKPVKSIGGSSKDLLSTNIKQPSLLKETPKVAPFVTVGFDVDVSQKLKMGSMQALLGGQDLEVFAADSAKIMEPVVGQENVLSVPAGVGGLGLAGLPFYPEGTKVKEGGYGLPSGLRFVGVRSLKRVYPILTGEEVVLGLAPKKRKGGKR